MTSQEPFLGLWRLCRAMPVFSMFSSKRAWQLAAAMFLVTIVAWRAAAAEEPAANLTAAGLRADYARLDAQYRRDLKHLSHLAYAREWLALGEIARGWRPPRPATGSLLYLASDQYGGGAPTMEEQLRVAEPLTEAAEHWLERFGQQREEFAESLFALAQKAAEMGELSLALQWAAETARENPDHAAARRVLGHEQRGGKWLTPYGARQADGGKSWHPKYGWIEAASAERYERGERLVGRRWVSAQIDRARRRRLEDGWQMRTDHFLITTDHSLEAAAELAVQLERLAQVWQQLFAGFYLSEGEAARLFFGEPAGRRRARPFQVFYHRDREQYVGLLRRRQPRIAETLGIYFDAQREAHFFSGDELAVGTLYHEAVHQLFQESRPAAQRVGRDANFWIIEGIATYFETLREHSDSAGGLYFTIGEVTEGRLPAARKRLLADEFYVPLAELTRWGQNNLQEHAELAKVYSQAAGMSAFLMEAEGGQYREPLVRYLQAVYSGRDGSRTLAEATGRSYGDLDAEYRAFMERSAGGAALAEPPSEAPAGATGPPAESLP